jgi:hypothetical protein
VPTLAFCPCAPVLVPDVAQGAASETAELLAACDGAVAWLAATTAPTGPVLVVGPGPVERHLDGSAGGTLAGFGVPVQAGGARSTELPLALTIGAWLLDRAAVARERRGYLAVAQDGSPSGAASTTALATASAVLVMGDGPARLSDRAPGGLDPEAAVLDAQIAEALGSGDPAALELLDAEAGARLLAAGTPAWRAVGSALREAHGADSRWDATVAAHRAPYGVSYLVATWA